MEIHRVIWLLLGVLNFVLGADKPSYFLVGGKLVLMPLTSESITNSLWKHNDDMIAGWSKDEGFTFYGSFEGRTTLDTSTGQLEITNMSKADVGLYSVEINWNVQDQSYFATAIKEVPQPLIWVSPVACTSATAWCMLNCDGETTEAQPVSYSWKMGDGEWKSGVKDMNITKNETAHFRTVSCLMKNPVSEKESEPKDNPFFQAQVPGASGVLGWVVFGVILVLVVVFLSLAWWKKDKIKSYLCHSRDEMSGDSRRDEMSGDSRVEKGAPPSAELAGRQSEVLPLNKENPDT